MLEWMQGYLAKRGDESPLVSARWLLSHATGLSNMQLYLDLERPLSPEELDALRAGVKRRGAGEPLQYITGTASFRHIELSVREGVLIPRPETEILVSEVLSRLPARRYNVSDADDDAEAIERTIKVVDLCTGTGCIACSLAHENPLIEVVATDVSGACVELARENVGALGLEGAVAVVECDLGQGVSEAWLGAIDAVVSNPPYVPTGVLAEVPAEVRDHEPSLALDGGPDGLDVFRRIVPWAHAALKPGGFLAVELHETTLDEAAAIARAAGFAATKVVRDLAGRSRVLIASKEES